MTDERGDAPRSDVPPQTPPAPPPPYPYGPYPGGYPPPPYGGYPPQPAGFATGPKNGLGIAALVTAIVGLVLVWSVVGGFVLGIVAIVLGLIAHGRCKRGEATNSGVAISGIVLGAIAIVVSLVFIAIWVTVGTRWFEDVGGRDYISCLEDAGNDQAAQRRCEDAFEKRLEDEFGGSPTSTR
ncbi:DUF4190 domain-containing protein [Mycobacterium sp. NPDC003449]